jgi:glycosyltransferase involved in cell wall biosynthesis
MVSGATTSSYLGYIDGLFGEELRGWAVSTDKNRGGLHLGLFAAGNQLGATVASDFRADVRDAGFGDGYSGFAFVVVRAIHDLVVETGGRIDVRVLDGSDHEIGHVDLDLTRHSAGGLNESSPHLEPLRKFLYWDAMLFGRLLAEAPENEAFNRARPPLTPHDCMFAPPATSDADEALVGGHDRLPAYLDFTRLRMRMDAIFDPDTIPDDYDHFLEWYITSYSVRRNGLRVPLSRDLIAYLNEPMVMGGQRNSLPRVMWWRLLMDRTRLGALDLSNDHHLVGQIFWWAWVEARALHVEDCLVTPEHIDLLRTVPAARGGDAFPPSLFIDHFYAATPGLQFLDGAKEKDCLLLTLALVVRGLSRPDILRFIPNRSLARMFERGYDGVSLFESFYQHLTLASEPVKVSFDRFAAVLRLQGYDLHRHTFLSISHKGHRVEAAARPPVTGKNKVDLQMIGPFEKASGLGQAARLSARIVEETSLTVNSVDFGLDNPAPEGFSKVGQLAEYRPARINLIHLNAESIPLAFAYQPDVFSGAYNIGYFFWELDSPAQCQALGMDLLDEIWVSTEFGVSIYAPATDKPVTNVGMCFEDVGAIDRTEARAFLDSRFGLDGSEFVFLVAFDSYSYIQRKNPMGVIEAFRRAFPGQENVRLVIKTQNRDNIMDPAQLRIWRRMAAAIARDPRVVLMNETLNYDALLQLKAACDCYISLHRSEGWGFGMIEAMNLRVPVVCTGYSGNMDFCSDETAWLVDYEEVALERDDYIFVHRGQKWAEPDLSDAAANLRAVWSDPAARAAKVAAAHANVHKNFSAKAIAKRYEARLREILETLG